MAPFISNFVSLSLLPVFWASKAALVVNNLPVKKDAVVIPGSGKSPGGGYGNLLLYSCLENPQGQRSLACYSWYRVAKSWTWLKQLMTNQDSIFKSRDITLPTKVCLVKAMVSPAVMYGCESWTVKKDEHWRIHASELWC